VKMYLTFHPTIFSAKMQYSRLYFPVGHVPTQKEASVRLIERDIYNVAVV